MTLILSGTDGLSDVDGSAATPAIRGTDANTGIFFPAADQVAITTGGTQRAVVDASGNVGIGTASPASDARLTLASPTTESYVMFSRTNSTFFDAAVGNNAGSLVFKGGADSATVAGLTEFMRIDSSGNVGIGTNGPSRKLVVSNAGAAGFEVGPGVGLSSGNEFLNYNRSTSLYVQKTEYASAYVFFAGTAGSTRAVDIDSSGNLLVGATSLASTERLNVTTTAGTGYSNLVARSTSATYTGSFAQFQVTAASSAGYEMLRMFTSAGSTEIIRMSGNGTITNATGVYGTISDIKLKENVVDATPKLDKLMQVRVVNYNLKNDPELKQIGVVAQELEQIFPNMITELRDTDSEGNDLGTTTKSVKYSIFVPMLIKAIQEQQAIITQLQADVAALQAPQGTP